MNTELTHFDQEGKARMVDVGDKPVTKREAIASGKVLMQPTTLEQIVAQQIKKGDVFAVARIAGIMAAKQTATLIPLCHQLPLCSAAIEFTSDPKSGQITIVATTKSNGSTGVEMEALTAVSVTALTIYDMCKAIDKEIEITAISLQKKTGGKSGSFSRNQ